MKNLFIGLTIGSIVTASYFTINEPAPCFANIHSTTPPYLAIMNQKWLENDMSYSEGMTYRDIIYHLKSENLLDIFVNGDKEFVVPFSCYVGDVDGFGDPILYRR